LRFWEYWNTQKAAPIVRLFWIVYIQQLIYLSVFPCLFFLFCFFSLSFLQKRKRKEVYNYHSSTLPSFFLTLLRALSTLFAGRPMASDICW